MLTDKTLLFFENAAGLEAEGIVELNGPANGKFFIAVAADPADDTVKVSTLTISLTTADELAEGGELSDPETLGTLNAPVAEIKKGLVSFCIPTSVKRFVKMEAVATGTVAKVVEDSRTGRKTGGLTAGYVPMVEQDGYIAPDMLELIK